MRRPIAALLAMLAVSGCTTLSDDGRDTIPNMSSLAVIPARTQTQELLASIPVYAVWALPTVGWLMLCSSWARSKPFLWALMIPLFAGIFVTWFDLMQAFDLESTWFWKNIVARALLSVAPGTWMDAAQFQDVDGPVQLTNVLLAKSYSVLATPTLWIGAVAGAAMIAAAIRLRRWRDEG